MQLHILLYLVELVKYECDIDVSYEFHYIAGFYNGNSIQSAFVYCNLIQFSPFFKSSFYLFKNSGNTLCSFCGLCRDGGGLSCWKRIRCVLYPLHRTALHRTCLTHVTCDRPANKCALRLLLPLPLSLSVCVCAGVGVFVFVLWHSNCWL